GLLGPQVRIAAAGQQRRRSCAGAGSGVEEVPEDTAVAGIEREQIGGTERIGVSATHSPLFVRTPEEAKLGIEGVAEIVVVVITAGQRQVDPLGSAAQRHQQLRERGSNGAIAVLPDLAI